MKNFFLLHSVQTDFGVQPDFYTVGTGQEIKLTTRPHPVLTLRMHGVLLRFPILLAGVGMITQKKNITFTQHFNMAKSISTPPVDIPN
jgi:hypothetical protein